MRKTGDKANFGRNVINLVNYIYVRAIQKKNQL